MDTLTVAKFAQHRVNWITVCQWYLGHTCANVYTSCEWPIMVLCAFVRMVVLQKKDPRAEFEPPDHVFPGQYPTH